MFSRIAVDTISPKTAIAGRLVYCRQPARYQNIKLHFGWGLSYQLSLMPNWICRGVFVWPPKWP